VSGLNHTLAKGAKGNSFHEFKSHRLRHFHSSIQNYFSGSTLTNSYFSFSVLIFILQSVIDQMIINALTFLS
jgi:hypothetical protein